MTSNNIAILISQTHNNVNETVKELFIETDLNPENIQEITVGRCNLVSRIGSDYSPSETFYHKNYFNKKIQDMQKEIDRYKKLDFLLD